MHRDDFISNVTMIIWNNVKLHLLQTACCNALLPATLNCAFLQGHQQHVPRPPSSQNEYATSACATRHDTIHRAVVHASTTACVYLPAHPTVSAADDGLYAAAKQLRQLTWNSFVRNRTCYTIYRALGDALRKIPHFDESHRVTVGVNAGG
jgi:hypothetical protein